ncbi:MAG TPA: BON domain-containing protein [Acidobacteriaceae bacterium]|nr:BON domain-containing protein [Acidobacteriaceae bacterium]
MNAHRTGSVAVLATLALILAGGSTGCKSSAADDATLNTQVQSKLFSDQGLRGEQIQTAVSGGVVTLNGTVSSDTARSSAAGDAAQVAGVKTVVNNLTVQAPAATATTKVPQPLPVQAAPAAAQMAVKPSPSRHDRERDRERDHNQPQPAPIVRNTPPPAPVQTAQAQPVAPPPQPQAPPPPPQPVVHAITLPAGTPIPIRITQTLDSATTQTGDKFTGTIASDIIVDGMVVLPQGAPVTGHVDEAKDAAHFKGSSLLTISLTSISHRGERIECSTEQYSREGAGRGKNTAEKTGGGAAVGAILGGILGGGKGAAIGAATGGGVGAGVNGVTRGQQVQIPSESVVRFKLADPIIVHVTTGGGPDDGSAPGLQRRSDQ